MTTDTSEKGETFGGSPRPRGECASPSPASLRLKLRPCTPSYNHRINCCYPALMEAPILLLRPTSATGALLSRSDQVVRQAARAENTERAYLGHWDRFCSWAQEQGIDMPEGLEAALCEYLAHLAEKGRRMATIRQARAAIVKGAELAGWPRSGGSDVAETMRGPGPGPPPPGAPETGGSPSR